ncbi:hypothetical protein N7447_004829 [Penicillium robsamsonii]|uniref:uncharacterized protein n=1 Tax=Penicillium robsamsonii TaxID=1792511 RepID=UPI002546584A|nr:uncharacterized protein N7447_004829 [Penicillium robsamsonii]KAJ5822489.1 hypothetical protein N7447_004829 [Penicillium robsamsonii]
MTEKNAPLGASNAKSRDAGKDTSIKDSAKPETTGSASHSSPKKRRKVNHGKEPLRSMHRDLGAADSVAHNDKNIFANVSRNSSLCILPPLDDEGSSNNELGTVQSMPRSVDVADAAGQQSFPDTTIGIAPSAVNPPSTVPPANLSASSQGLEANSHREFANKLVLPPLI